MEDAVIALLADHGQVAVARADAPGVYVDECKIASLGLRVRRGCSFHGLALNVDMDLQPFSRINPCGYAGMQMTQLRDLYPDADIDTATKNLLNYLVKRLDYTQVELANHLES